MLNPLNRTLTNIPKDNKTTLSSNFPHEDSMKEVKTSQEYFWNKIIIKKDEE